MKQKTYTVQFRRKREGKTNYKMRMRLLQSKKPRLVVRPSLMGVCAQIIEFFPEGDRIVAAAHSRELEKYGWRFHKGNIPSAYLTGLLVGIKAKKKGVKEAVLDIGLRGPVKGSRIFACLKGAVDAGLAIAHSESIISSSKRISGKHIVEYWEMLKKENKYAERFSDYVKRGVDAGRMVDIFNDVKDKILKVKK